MDGGWGFWTSATPRDRSCLCVESVGCSVMAASSRTVFRDGWRAWQIMLVVDGAGLASVGDGSEWFDAGVGDLWIMPADLPHRYRAAPDCPRFSYLWIELGGAAAASLMAMLGLDRRHRVSGCVELRDAVEEVHGIFRVRRETGQHEATAATMRLLAALERKIQEPEAAGPPLVEQAKRWLEKHYAQDLRLDDLARALGVSPFHLSRRFRSATGMPPMAYLRRLRANRAKALLHGSGLGIAQVGRAVGYPLAPHFSRMFRAETGMSPRDFVREVVYGRRSALSAPEPRSRS